MVLRSRAIEFKFPGRPPLLNSRIGLPSQAHHRPSRWIICVVCEHFHRRQRFSASVPTYPCLFCSIAFITALKLDLPAHAGRERAISLATCWLSPAGVQKRANRLFPPPERISALLAPRTMRLRGATGTFCGLVDLERKGALFLKKRVCAVLTLQTVTFP